MTLKDAFDRVLILRDDDVIFAARPWTLTSEAEIGPFDSDYRIPEAYMERKLEYFLEASVAHEVLGVFGDRKFTDDERNELLLFYAENDAYPDWVYK